MKEFFMLQEKKVRSRFAPSPTGFMTIGNLRTALYEYLIAKRADGVFILRVEDTDQNRYVEGSMDAVLDTLRLTGLYFDEGPGIGGDYGPYVQSQRKDSYLPHALKLIQDGHAYYCFCDKERLESLSDPHGAIKYDRHCLRLSPSEVKARLDGCTAYVIRQIIPEGRTTFKDEVYGEITIDNKEMDDQILIKSDGMPTYNFANVVDDHAMAITHVMRGCEYLTSTPKYKLLYEAFGWDVPLYVHLPLMTNPDGKKISKRNGDASIPELVKAGYLPDAIVNYAALLGWSPPDHHEVFTLDELTQVFDISGISKSPSIFDIKKLTWMNGEHIKRLPAEVFCDMALPVLQQAVTAPGMDYPRLAQITQSRVSFVHECAELLDFVDVLPEYDLELFTHKKMKTNPEIARQALTLTLAALEPLTAWDNATLYETATQLAEANGLNRSQVLWPLRTALSGKPTSPCGATELCELLGKGESLKRISTGIQKLSAHA
jgi:glutamyl-tRNA synthetase